MKGRQEIGQNRNDRTNPGIIWKKKALVLLISNGIGLELCVCACCSAEFLKQDVASVGNEIEMSFVMSLWHWLSLLGAPPTLIWGKRKLKEKKNFYIGLNFED